MVCHPLAALVFSRWEIKVSVWCQSVHICRHLYVHTTAYRKMFLRNSVARIINIKIKNIYFMLKFSWIDHFLVWYAVWKAIPFYVNRLNDNIQCQSEHFNAHILPIKRTSILFFPSEYCCWQDGGAFINFPMALKLQFCSKQHREGFGWRT